MMMAVGRWAPQLQVQVHNEILEGHADAVSRLFGMIFGGPTGSVSSPGGLVVVHKDQGRLAFVR